MQAAAQLEFEYVSPEDLAAFSALEAAAQVPRVPPAPPPPAPQPLPFPPPPSAGNVTCELLSATHFAVRVPAGARPYAQAALACQPVRLVTSTNTGDELVAALGDYEQVLFALDRAGLFRAMPRGGAAFFDGGGRVPAATLAAMRAVAQQQPLDARQHAEQDELYARIPKPLRDVLLPFQREGVRIGLQRNGRMLLADEVGVGKTLQALALAAAYSHEGPILVICPASLRYMWAEQVEKWLRVPPHACTVVLGSDNKPELDNLPRRGDPQPAAAASPRVVITSYHMLQQVDLTVDWARFAWGCVVVDESHNLRAANRDESAQTQIAVRVIKATLRAILMSGTPALNRPFDLYCQVDALHPGLLKSKEVFANGYCERRPNPYKRGAFIIGGGTRLQELHLLLRSTVMLRRLKMQVAAELPPMCRQVVRLDVPDSHSVVGFADMEKAHQVGWRKVEAACEWLGDALLRKGNTPKSVIFVYHLDIMKRLKAFLETRIGSSDGTAVRETPYVTIEGEDSARARQDAVLRFKSPHVRVALLSISAASTGLDFSDGEAVVFVELPQSASDLEQAEARVHRRGVRGDVNVYYLVGRGTQDETAWSTLDAAIQRCHEVHGAADSGGLRVESVVDAAPGAAQLLPSHPAAPAASEVLPSQPDASPAAPDGDVVDVPAHALFFEMSVHTGLLHAFLQDGDDFQHLGSERLPLVSRKPDFPFSLPAVRSAAVAFKAVWDGLRIVDHGALRRTAKPMRLPLDDTLRAALAAWKSAPSTIRVARRAAVIPAPLAGWKTKKYVFMKKAGSELRRYELYIGADDEWLCWACSKEPARVQHAHGGSDDPLVTSLLDLCCSLPCHNNLQAKTSRSWGRKQLFKEERGVCQMCKIDCEELKSRLQLGSECAQLALEDQCKLLLQLDPRFKDHETLMMKALIKGGVLWEADHVIPVAEGGGQCGRENLRTLCLICHVGASGAQAGRGAKKRRAAKASRAVAVDQPLDDATLAALGRCAADDEDEFAEDKPPNKSKSTKPKKAKAKAGNN